MWANRSRLAIVNPAWDIAARAANYLTAEAAQGMDRSSTITRLARGLPDGNDYERDRPNDKKVVHFRGALQRTIRG
jgi:hypothetical protein